MDKKKIPLNAYLILVFIILAIFYVCSIFRKPETDSRKLIKTALINPKYSDQISQIQISSDNQLLVLQKNQNWWEIVDLENPMVCLPADSARIYKMIEQLSSVIGVYKVSSKNNSTDFGFKENGIQISFNTGLEEVSELHFGKNDFSQSKRFVKSRDISTVYEMEDLIAPYLTTSVQNWSEPTIISQQVLGKISVENIQRLISNNKIINPSASDYSSYLSKLLELRHGGINTNLTYPNTSPIYLLKLELGNKDNIYIKIWDSSFEGIYLVAVSYEDESSGVEYTYYENISSWTLSKLKYE